MNEVKNLSLVSIVVPIYNTAPYIRQCLDSLVNQTYKHLELILVDDGSTDHSGEICDQYQKDFDFVKVIHKPNGGVSSARQAGVMAASGDWITIVDSDDWLSQDAITSMTDAQRQHGVELVICSYQREYANRSFPMHIFNTDQLFRGAEYQNKIYRRLYGPLKEELRNPANLDSLGSACMKLYPRPILQSGNYVNNKVVGSAEDVLLNMSVLHKLDSAFYLDKPLYHYRKTNSTSLSNIYRADLAEKWQHLYALMGDYIEKFNLNSDFHTALNNRIVCAIIGLGLNEISATGKNLFYISRRFKQILNFPNYQQAFRQFELSYLPFKWKVFFGLAKYKQTLLLIFMLKSIATLRKIIAN